MSPAAGRCVWLQHPPSRASTATHHNKAAPCSFPCPSCASLGCRQVCLAAAGPPQKGIYSLLGSLVQYVGARKLLHMQPDLIGQLLAAMERGTLGSVVPNLLHKLLEQLRRELLAAAGALSP